VAGIYRKQRQHLELTGLVDNINAAALAIDFGRKGFATRGKAEKGRFSYEEGIDTAMSAFQKAQTIILLYLIGGLLFHGEFRRFRLWRG